MNTKLTIVLFVVITVILFVAALKVWINLNRPAAILPPSSTSYMKAVEICGDRGIFNLTWENFSKGEIESIYCR